MKQTLKQLVEETKDTPMGQILAFEKKRAERMDGKLNFDDVEIGEVDEMGDAAGDCDMFTKKIRIRKDIVGTKTHIRRKLKKILVHEGEHFRGTHHEGVAELVTKHKTGETATHLYADRHKAAKELANEIGTQELVDTSRRHGKEADVHILQNYVKKQVAKNVHPAKAKAKGEKLIKRAA